LNVLIIFAFHGVLAKINKAVADWCHALVGH